MYERVLEGTWELFGDYLSGAREAMLCVVSSAELGGAAKAALQSSFAKLGYGKAACTFFTLQGKASCDGRDGRDGLPPLAEKEIYAVLEGMDPCLLVIADAQAAKACSRAYRLDIPLDQRSRVFGREVRAFASFESMLDDPKGKQGAWALLKTLPKFSG
ncbi:MAG: hypothetical protein FWE65_00130 [Eggerthellaceae bacterium]|nr:hypothetical protein [Eggerthellaceae bacterium]